MVLLGDIPNQFASTVRSKCGEAYALLLKAARPILHYGSEEEVALHNYQADDSFIFTFNRVMQPWNLESIIVALAQLQHSRTLNTNHRRTGRFEIQPSLKKHTAHNTLHTAPVMVPTTRVKFLDMLMFLFCVWWWCSYFWTWVMMSSHQPSSALLRFMRFGTEPWWSWSLCMHDAQFGFGEHRRTM